MRIQMSNPTVSMSYGKIYEGFGIQIHVPMWDVNLSGTVICGERVKRLISAAMNAGSRLADSWCYR